MSSLSSRSRGFTLVELMLVVGILALVAMLAVKRLSGISESARRTAAESDLQALRDAFVAEERGYLRDLGGIPGFSPAYVRVGNLFAPTNVWGTAVLTGGAGELPGRGIRLDGEDATEARCAAEHRARPAAFTGWDASRGRGWRGPYVTSGTPGFFPARDARRFADDATFGERRFFPNLTHLLLPEAFKDGAKASVYGFVGEPALFDPWGNPYVLQVPPPQAFPGVTNVPDAVRFKYARVVSAGPDGILDTPCFTPNATNELSTSWSARTRRLARQAGLVDGTNAVARGDDLVLFLVRGDVDEGEERQVSW